MLQRGTSFEFGEYLISKQVYNKAIPQDQPFLCYYRWADQKYNLGLQLLIDDFISDKIDVDWWTLENFLTIPNQLACYPVINSINFFENIASGIKIMVNSE